MVILGISSFVFDSSASLIVSGQMVAAAQEERFTREKNTGDFPENAIEYCLTSQGLTIDDVDHVAFYWRPYKGLLKRAVQIISTLPESFKFWGSHSGKWGSMRNCESILKEKFPGKYKFKFHNISHHVSHAASGFFVSQFRESNILVMDGAGEIASTSLCVGNENNIEIIKSIDFPHSLGYLYVSLTHYLGFKPDNDEYKVMALASMGKESQYYDFFKEIVILDNNGGYHFDLSYMNYHKGNRNPWVSNKFIERFGPLRTKDQPLTERQQDIAWALQKRLEDVALHLINYAHQVNPSKNLIITGGCGLNCIMNEVLTKNGPYENVWVNSVPHDAGTSMGAAFWVYNHILSMPRKFVFESALWGPEFNDQEIESELKKASLEYKKLDENDLILEVCQLLREKNIIGWFQGRTEFGPRALGCRSILADPTHLDMKDIINQKIKHREPFRPFAPAIIEELVGEFFEEKRKLPFMTFILKVKEEVAKQIPAVVHFDNTARVQTVSEKINPRFHKLIKEFGKLSSIPILLNTSFNDNGEPIVNSPNDAISSFKRTNLDYMAIGNYLVKKEN